MESYDFIVNRMTMVNQPRPHLLRLLEQYFGRNLQEKYIIFLSHNAGMYQRWFYECEIFGSDPIHMPFETWGNVQNTNNQIPIGSCCRARIHQIWQSFNKLYTWKVWS